MKTNQIVTINNKFYLVESVDNDICTLKELRGSVISESSELDTIHNRLDKLEEVLKEILELSKAIRERQIDIKNGYR
nr:MAG TPA: E2 glycoprotein [Caudoviricetes sp.]